MQINAALIHVPERETPDALMKALDSVAIHKTIFTDVVHKGAMWNHRRAISWAAMMEGYTLIVEDDAIAGRRIGTHLHGLIAFMEEHKNIKIGSLYYGQGAPVDAQPTMKQDYEIASLDKPDSYGNKYITADRLYHAVAYVLSQETAKELTELMHGRDYPEYSSTDFTIQQTLPKEQRYFTYCIPSPIQHNDDLNSTFPHMGIRPTVPRVAYEFEK